MSKIKNTSVSGSGKSSDKKERRHRGGQGKMSDDSSIEDKAEMGMIKEMEKAFQKALDVKFGRIEKRILEMEEKSDKVYKLIQERRTTVKEDLNYHSGSDESTYRALVDLMEQNNEETKRTSKQLETLNSKQNDLITNTQELVEKTSRIQKTIKSLQHKAVPVTGVQHQEKIHSGDQEGRFSSTSKDGGLDSHKIHFEHVIEETYQKCERLNDLVEQVCQHLEYSDKNANKMLEKLTSMAHAVEATTVQGKVLHDNMTKRMDNIGTGLEKRLSGLGKMGIDIEIAKEDQCSISQVVSNIESTMNEVVKPLLNNTYNLQKETLGEGKKFKDAIEKIHHSVHNSDSMNISNEQNLENLSNIMESLTKLNQDTSEIRKGCNNIINYKLSEDFVQGMCQMMIDNKTILDHYVDKKSLSSLTSSVHDIKLSEAKVNIQLKEIKSICSELAEKTKGSHVKQHVDIAADIKKFESDRFDEIKQSLQKLQKAQSKAGGKQPVDKSNKKKGDESHGSSDEASMHSMLLQMEIKKASSEQTKILNKMETKLQELRETQTGHHNWMIEFKKGIDSGLTNLSKKLIPLAQPRDMDFSKLEDTLKACITDHTNTTIEEFQKYADIQHANSNMQTEILNSIEDMKLLTSSIPNSVNDLVPVIEKAMAEIETFPDNINGCIAGLEENLCANLEGRLRPIPNKYFKEVCDKFDTIEQRLLIIRKYVKYGQSTSKETQSDNGSDTARDDGKDISFAINNTISYETVVEKMDSIYNAIEQVFNEETNLQKDVEQMKNSLLCLNDLKLDMSGERIQRLASDLSTQVISMYKDEFSTPLTNIANVQLKILEQQDQQAKAAEVEDQFLALADEIMPRIKELKAIEDNLVTFCQDSLEPMFENIKESIMSVQERSSIDDISTMLQNQFDDVRLSLSQLEDKLTKNQSVMLDCFRSASKFNSQAIFTDSQRFVENKRLVNDRDVETKDKRKGLSEIRSSISAIKNTLNKRSDKKTNTSGIKRKRSPSPSTDDSIIDTNSEAQDHIREFVPDIDASKTKRQFTEETNLNQSSSNHKRNQTGTKRRKPGVSDNGTKVADESRAEQLAAFKPENQTKLTNWMNTRPPEEKPFDCASIMSEDVYP